MKASDIDESAVYETKGATPVMGWQLIPLLSNPYYRKFKWRKVESMTIESDKTPQGIEPAAKGKKKKTVEEVTNTTIDNVDSDTDRVVPTDGENQ